MLEVRGKHIEEAVTRLLNDVLAIACGERTVEQGAADAVETIAAPIRGQGADYSTMLDELIGDLLNQLDVNGCGLRRARLDGMLQRDDGGYSAWGYVLGVPDGTTPSVRLTVDEAPIVAQSSGGITIFLRLRTD
jgi:hypothetical protein